MDGLAPVIQAATQFLRELKTTVLVLHIEALSQQDVPLEAIQGPPSLLASSQTSPVHLKMLAETSTNQNIGNKTVLHLRKRRQILDSNYPRLLVIGKCAPQNSFLLKT